MVEDAIDISMLAMGLILVYYVSRTGNKSDLKFKSIHILPLLVVFNEVLMSIFLYQALYHREPITINNLLSVFSASISSYLFILPMEIEMIFSILFLENDRLKKIAFSSIAGISLFNPAIVPSRALFLSGTIYSAISMVIFMIIIFEEIARRFDTMNYGRIRMLVILFLIFTLSSAGILLGDIYVKSQYYWLLAVSMLSGMYYYLYYLNSTLLRNGKPGWVNNRYNMFYVLGLSFASEWLISAAIEFISSSSVRGTLGFLTSFGIEQASSLSQYLVYGLYVFGSVTNNYVFLLVMGSEMIALVIFRMRSLKWREKKWNLAMAIAAYALYTIFWPNFAPASYYSKVPLWGNVGSLGPVYPGILLALIGSYVLYAILALLFGRRSYCSTLCPSAVMYGGTLGQAMIKYNYTAPLSRKNIGSRFKGYLYPIITSSWILILIASYISYRISVTGNDAVSIYGIDPAIFYSYIVWNVMWYLFFISIPLIGMSPCRRYGWCTTGTFVGFFSKIGFFRLKVRDPSICLKCETKACATACEVGAGDLPGQFIKQGYFKSAKCVGSGSCVIACPYNNIYFYDIRSFISDRLSKFRKKEEGETHLDLSVDRIR
ncbi:4Fe-4S binding protein [Thermoplasma volcanium]|uniref:4Fe-4S binding protein n=1 Tax=Thermoplasma volcanium TaxID=50339 RepID=UPI0012EA8427|nr:4Fe-4S binding protein [Thermoplasma volcanium]